MKRALRAGHPFSAALKLVAEDMEDPIAREFELTFADINYGNDLRRAMLGPAAAGAERHRDGARHRGPGAEGNRRQPGRDLRADLARDPRPIPV